MKKIKYFSRFYHNIISVLQKNIRLYSTHYFVMKIPNKKELQQIAFNHSSNNDFQDFLNLYKKGTAEPHSFNQIILHVLEGIF